MYKETGNKTELVQGWVESIINFDNHKIYVLILISNFFNFITDDTLDIIQFIAFFINSIVFRIKLNKKYFGLVTSRSF